MNPLVSVIIPTANRPHYLPRAVDSALAGMEQGEIEVIVVPNGPDDSWKESLLPYRNNPSVKVIPIAEANANIARNTGLAKARGEFVRFLDDDDYLIPESAVKQYELIQVSGADVVSGSVQLVDIKGRAFDVWRQPDTDDFCAAVLGPWRACQPTAHVYRKFILKGIKWNSTTLVRQDVEWLFDLCLEKELTWRRTDLIVGVWVQHRGARISIASMGDSGGLFRIPKVYRQRDRSTASILLTAYERLQVTKRLNSARTRSVALGLWKCVNASFCINPQYWKKVAELAMEIDAEARPGQAIYKWPFFKHLDPVFVQWLLLPKRKLAYGIRYFRKRYLI